MKPQAKVGAQTIALESVHTRITVLRPCNPCFPCTNFHGEGTCKPVGNFSNDIVAYIRPHA